MNSCRLISCWSANQWTVSGLDIGIKWKMEVSRWKTSVWSERDLHSSSDLCGGKRTYHLSVTEGVNEGKLTWRLNMCEGKYWHTHTHARMHTHTHTQSWIYYPELILVNSSHFCWVPLPRQDRDTRWKRDKSETIAAILVLAGEVTSATRLHRWWQTFEDCERWIKISSRGRMWCTARLWGLFWCHLVFLCCCTAFQHTLILIYTALLERCELVKQVKLEENGARLSRPTTFWVILRGERRENSLNRLTAIISALIWEDFERCVFF